MASLAALKPKAMSDSMQELLNAYLVRERERWGLQQQLEPSEVIVKLVLPFIEWKEVIQTEALVCKRWKAASESDDVWSPICNGEIADFELVLDRWKEYGRDKDYVSTEHELLVTQLGRKETTGRSCRDIFVLSQRMGKLITDHREYGPDGTKNRDSWNDDSTMTLRQLISHDYPLIVQPAIENLRRVFCEADDSKREHALRIADMKSKLYIQAQSHTILRRKQPSYLGREKIFELAGQYMLAAGTMSSVSIDEDAFLSLSPIQSSLSEMVKVIENLLGDKLSLSISVQLKSGSSGGLEKVFTCQPPTKKLRSMNCLNDLEWPLNPKDNMCFLVSELWFDENEYIDDCNKLCGKGLSRSLYKEKEAELMEIKRREWWIGLTETIRQLLLNLYEELAELYTDVESLPEEFDWEQSRDHIPTEVLKHICNPPTYQSFRGKISLLFWNNLKPELRDAMFNLYEQQCNCFLAMIRQEYISIYGGVNQETTAKTLLDIFLEVPPQEEYTQSPEMTTDYCQALLGRMEESMNRWDQLIASAQEDDHLWNPQTISEINSISSKFGVDIVSHRRRFTRKNEFCTDYMLKRYLCQLLSSEDEVPRYYGMRYKIAKVHSDMKELADENSGEQFTKYLYENLADVQKAIHEFESYRKFVHIREHAMIALIPMLPSLSEFDSKRLVYAIFIQRNRFLARSGNEFSRRENFDDLYDGELPPPKASSSFHQPMQDLMSNVIDALKWMHSESGNSYRHEVASRLFGLPLPKNIVQAMCQFMLENLYQTGSPNAVNYNKSQNAFKVLRYMKRFAYENLAEASLVWNTLDTAIQNATTSVQDIDVDDVGAEALSTFRFTVESLIGACIKTRAETVIPIIESLYRNVPAELMPDNIVPLETLIQRIHEAPKIAVDTGEFHSIW